LERNLRYAALGVLAAAILAVVKVQFLTPTLWEADGYYHIRVADLIRTTGPLKSFHWARYSFFADRFADKDFLYHVLLVPFTMVQDLVLGGKLAACFTAALFIIVFWLVLKKYSHPALVPLFLAALLLSDHFLYALSRPRSMVAAMALMVLGIHFLIRRKLPWIFALAFLYGLEHITAPLMVFFAVAIELVRHFEDGPEGGFSWRPVAASAGGLLAGILLHPNFPNNILFTKLNLFLVPYYAAKGGVLELGAEFFPISTRDLLLGYPLLFPAILFMIAALMVRPVKAGFPAKAFFVCSAPFFLGMFLSQRYAVHGYPLYLLWMGAHFSAWDREDVRGMGRAARLLALGGLGAAVLAAGFLTAGQIRRRALMESFVNGHYERVAGWFRRNVPPGEVIFHANWSDSQYFIGLNPQNDYFVTLDPIYMYAWDPGLYQLYRDAAHGRTADPYQILKDVFRVRYGYAGKNFFGNLIAQVRADPRFQVMAEDPLGVIFKLK